MARRKATVRAGKFLGFRVSEVGVWPYGGVRIEFRGNLAICSWNPLATLTAKTAKKLGQALIDVAETVERERGK